jgi:DNA-binding response OmpR family regulator
LVQWDLKGRHPLKRLNTLNSYGGITTNCLMNETTTGSNRNVPSGLRVLFVDDDIKFCRLTSSYLTKHGYEVTLVHEGNAALQQAATASWDAIILDVMLPGIDGYEVLRRIRERSEVPVLMLTALGDEETDRIVGLEIGADDYLPKTFSPRELLARLKAVVRRSVRTQSTNHEQVLGSLTINPSARLAHLDNELLPLTSVEFDLLLVLVQAKGRIKTREQLLSEIRDRNFDISDRSIDVHISGLRRKLQDDPKNPRFIRTVRSAGYLFINQEESKE